jgi:hypothetical protein
VVREQEPKVVAASPSKVVAASPSKVAAASPSLVFRLELLHAWHTKPDRKVATAAVGNLKTLLARR